MIYKAQLISPPVSGQYDEKIYDIPSQWNSNQWTWVKFVDEDFYEWVGEFRGAPRHVALSKKYNRILVLTSDYLFEIDCESGNLIDHEGQHQYTELTVTPLGDFIVADHYGIELIKSTIKEKYQIVSPVHMELIKFHNWSNNTLLITCDEFMNWDNHVELELNCETFEIVERNT